MTRASRASGMKVGKVSRLWSSQMRMLWSLGTVRQGEAEEEVAGEAKGSYM